MVSEEIVHDFSTDAMAFSKPVTRFIKFSFTDLSEYVDAIKMTIKIVMTTTADTSQTSIKVPLITFYDKSILVNINLQVLNVNSTHIKRLGLVYTPKSSMNMTLC
jgi:hypothetical protein